MKSHAISFLAQSLLYLMSAVIPRIANQRENDNMNQGTDDGNWKQ